MKHTEYITPIGEDAQDYDEMFIGVIRRQPELVRCKDCIWNREKEWVDCYMSGMHGRNVNNFCSQGKRKEE